MWFILQLSLGLLAMGLSTYHAFLMKARAAEATALGFDSLAAMAYGMVGFHLILAAVAFSCLCCIIKSHCTLKHFHG